MRTEQPVTIVTVARHAGVSKTTASDALRGSGRVSEQTRRRIEDAARKLGYAPNNSARHLRQARTGTIGLHLPEVLPRSDYYMSFVFGVVQAATGHDYDVTLMTSRHGRGSTLASKVDGLIIGDPLAGDPTVETLMTSNVPVVTCERYPGDKTPDGVVRSEHRGAVRELLDHLRTAGARQPGLIVAGDESDWAGSVHSAYREWCAEHGLEAASSTVPFDSTTDVIRTAATNLLRGEPAIDALVCAPAGAAAELGPVLRGAASTLRPGFLVASCVDTPATKYADPPITALDLAPQTAGASCADLLFDLLTGAAEPGTERLHPVRLTIRASTQP
ncbi:LacI family DNA-binding transcriptional regulator [Phytoactinopolyspora limicola]|uniref:LacI family DNA-binding transcriptional regulator n=1 Tax=Phytoactinopolyspora limicola TaxID=2715536 RepID=UPI001408A9F2|nr:LacI family DNA-binding transcriptional regulator [Phytoactinopolyspora limicola]